VKLGASETIRNGTCGTRTVRPNSSTTSRMAGCEGAGGVEDCAYVGKTERANATRTRWLARCARLDKFRYTNSPGEVLREFANKNPARSRERSGGVLSREVGPTTAAREGSLALGDEADYSGGTAADLHGTSPLPWPAGFLIEFNGPWQN